LQATEADYSPIRRLHLADSIHSDIMHLKSSLRLGHFMTKKD